MSILGLLKRKKAPVAERNVKVLQGNRRVLAVQRPGLCGQRHLERRGGDRRLQGRLLHLRHHLPGVQAPGGWIARSRWTRKCEVSLCLWSPWPKPSPGSTRTGISMSCSPKMRSPKATQPCSSAAETAEETDKPINRETDKPTKGKPGTRNPEPGTRNPEPGTRNPEPGTRNPEPGTRNPEPGTRNPEPGTRNPEPENPEPGTRNPEPGTRNPEPGTRNPEPGTRNPEPGTRNPEPGTRNPEPGTRNPEPRNPEPGTRNFFSPSHWNSVVACGIVAKFASNLGNHGKGDGRWTDG